MKIFKSKVKKYYAIALVSLAIIVSIGSATDNYFEISKNLDIYATLYREVNTFYVEEINPSELMRRGIDAMLSSLDPYTNFISESEIEDYRFMTTGQYGGIGASISRREGTIFITEVYQGFSADKSGLIPGDMIIMIDDISAKDMTSSQVSDLLKGQPGSDVKLTIERPGVENELKIDIIREEVHVPNIPYYGMLENDMAYVRLAGFKQGATVEVRNALTKLKKDNNVKGVILDLRGNPGGLLNESVSLVNLFVGKGNLVVSTKGRVSEWDNSYETRTDAWDENIPVVVLVSETSASASEIVSGALQDLDRGVVIGQTTFGKGLVQTTRPLSFNSQLKITTAKYYIPSGRCIQSLDYSDRSGRGSVVKLSDTLRTVFYTKNGRTVYDSDGILPDIALESINYAEITKALIRNFMIFDFATTYRHENPVVNDVSELKIDDKMFNDFIGFLNDKNFEFTSNTELALKEMITAAENENYHSKLENDIDMIMARLADLKENDLNKHRKEISNLLYEELVSRYFYRHGRTKVSLDFDPEVEKAISVLTETETYKDILTVAK